ncbi:MAG: exodeoxyribonuclease V subunit gamma, partial [Clostridia bacterium]|nr:exodeoxyribonuclease V subunit gamma [Clostridia bacterium]
MPKEEPLAEKLRDLGSVIGCFEAELEHRFEGGEDDLDRLAQLLQGEAAALFTHTHIYVDSFTDYTKQELEILRALMRHAPSASFSFSLNDPSDDGIHLASPVATHRLLRRIADELALPVQFVRPEKRRAQSAKEYLARNIFCMNAEPAPLAMAESPDIAVTLCEDPFAEAEAVTAEIQRLVRAGCRYRDITVVLRDATARSGILDAAMEREGIPFFLSEKTDITTRPLIKLILLALRICQNGWRDEDVVSYLKTGLCGPSADDINLFEEYVNVWHPRGARRYVTPFTRNPDGYDEEPTARGARISEGANRVRAHITPTLLDFFTALDNAEGATAMCRALYSFLCSLGVAEQLKDEAAAALAAGDRRDAEELSKLYGVVVEALDAIALALEDEPLSVAQFAEALRLVFSRTDIGSIPTSADEVTVGSASMLRADHPRFVLILGLNDGEFPRNVSDEGLLSDAEKEHLRAHGLEFPSNRAERASDELFFIYRALCAPREGLHLFYNKSTTAGAACAPSIAISRAKALFPGLTVREFSAEDPLRHIYSAGAALDRLSELPREQRQALQRLLCELRLPAAETLDHPIVQRAASLSRQTATALYQNARFSPSQLESFSACRFAYYCE